MMNLIVSGLHSFMRLIYSYSEALKSDALPRQKLGEPFKGQNIQIKLCWLGLYQHRSAMSIRHSSVEPAHKNRGRTHYLGIVSRASHAEA